MKPDSNDIDYFQEAEFEAETPEAELENVFSHKSAGETEERQSAQEPSEPLHGD